MTTSAKNRTVFITRLISWLLIGCVTPIVFFASQFGLFEEVTVVKDELGNVIARTDYSLNGWGIVSCVLVGSFISNILKEVSDAYVGYSMLKQCYKGLCSTMPLIIAFSVCYFLNGVLEQAMLCLIVIIICKLISTPINPIPKWKYEKRGIEDYCSLSEIFTKFVKKQTKGGGE
jgi:hypothetical protein